MSLVSVVVTSKNEERNIGKLLSSIGSQTYKDTEIIVVDNNSTDETVKVAREFTKMVYDKGPERSAQRNFGVRKANGRYILVVDADMELSPDVVKSCVENIPKYKALIVPEKTQGNGFLSSIRKFEREMYMGDATIEVARFFEKKTFEEFGGYDLTLTGTEDYDLPKRIMDKYGKDSIGWAKEWIFHHEESLTLAKLLMKRFYYAGKSVGYVKKHPGLIWVQGNMILRPAYFRNWKKFINKPFIALAFIFVRILEMSAALLGFIYGVLIWRK